MVNQRRGAMCPVWLPAGGRIGKFPVIGQHIDIACSRLKPFHGCFEISMVAQGHLVDGLMRRHDPESDMFVQGGPEQKTIGPAAQMVSPQF